MYKKAAHFFVNHPLKIMLFTLGFAVFSILGLNKLESISGFKMWFSPQDPYLLSYEQYEKNFGNDDNVVVAIHSPSGIFDKESVAIIKDLTAKMWKIDDVIRVDSLANHQMITGGGGDILIESVLESDDAEFLKKRGEQVIADDQIVNLLISEDLKTATVFAQLKPLYEKKGQYREAVRQVQKLTREYPNRGDHSFYITGSAALSSAYDDVAEDTMYLTPIMVLIMMTILYLSFRSLRFSLMAVGLIAISVLMVFGLSGWFGIKYHSMTSCLPQILIAITLADVVHFLATFFKERSLGRSKKLAAETAIEINFMPTLMTSVTTSLGFLTFCTSELIPVRELGILASLGVMLAWAVSIGIAPAAMMYFPSRQGNKAEGETLKAPEKNYKWVPTYLDWIERWRYPVVIGWALFFAGSTFLASKVSVNADISNYFSDSTEIKKASDFMSANFGGSRGIEMVIDSGKPDGVKDVHFLSKLMAYEEWILEQKEVTKVMSIGDIVAELSSALEAPTLPSSRMPASSDSVAQQLFLYSMSLPVGMGLNYWATLDYQKTRMKIYWDIEDSQKTLTEISRYEEKAKDLGLNAVITGKAALLPGLNHHIIETFQDANFRALLLIIITMILIFRSLKIGLLSMIPNIIPSAFGGAVMYLLGLKLDAGTILVMSVVMGIAVDDTIHFLSHYQDCRKEGLSVRDSLSRVFHEVTFSLSLTTGILILGFSLSVFSHFMPFANFGLMTAICLSFAIFADFMLLPAIFFIMAKGERVKASA